MGIKLFYHQYILPVLSKEPPKHPKRVAALAIALSILSIGIFPGICYLKNRKIHRHKGEGAIHKLSKDILKRESPLQNLILNSPQNLEDIQKLIARTNDRRTLEDALKLAISKNAWQIIQLLAPKVDLRNDTYIQQAIKGHHPEALITLLLQGADDKNAKTKDPLLKAILEDFKQATTPLQISESQVDLFPKSLTSQRILSFRNSLEPSSRKKFEEWFLECKKLIRIPSKTNLARFKELIKSEFAQKDILSYLFHDAAKIGVSRDWIALLHDYGADFNHIPDHELYNNTALIWAIANARNKTAIDIIEIGNKDIHLDHQGLFGNTALHLAVAKGYFDKDSSGNPTGASNLDLALALLSSSAQVNAQNEAGLTPLHFAALRKDSALIALLLNKGADKALRDQRDRTAFDFLQFSSDESNAILKEQVRVFQKVSHEGVDQESLNKLSTIL